MFRVLIASLLIFWTFFPISGALAVTKKKIPSQRSFNIKDVPPKQDWRYFMKADDVWRKSLWNYYKSQGKLLSDWSWGWRMGWVRKCATTADKYCNSVLKQALFDEAAVVRAEAASRIGTKYAGTKKRALVKLLSRAYRNKANYRKGKPLFVQQRILFAVKSIGGKYSKKLGKKMAKSHAGNLAYWKKIDIN